MSGRNETLPIRRILKYRLDQGKPTPLGVGKGATPLYFGSQNGLLFVWVEVVERAGPRTMRFEVFGTGDHLPDGATYIGTTIVSPYVWHLYEIL